MLSPTFVLWDVGYPLYTFGSIFIIILLIWQVKKNYHRIMEPKRSCCRRHWKARQKERNAASKARSHTEEEFEKPKKLLSVIKSQGWHPQEGNVRRLLCANPFCDICNDVALEIQQLLAGEHAPISKDAQRPSQSSACPEIMSRSTVTFEQISEHHSLSHSNDLVLPSAVRVMSLYKRQSSVTQLCATSPSVVSVHDYWAEHDQLKQEFQVTEETYDSNTRFSSEPKESTISVCQQTTVLKVPDTISENQEPKLENSSPSIYTPLAVNEDVTAKALAHPVAMHMVTVDPTHPPILSPEILRYLEIHVKKWMHFQRWGLPRRVEESMRQFMPHPPLFYQPENNQPLSLIQKYTSNLAIERFGTLSYQTWGSCMAGQPTQAFWVSEWSIIDSTHKYHYQRIQNHLSLILPSPAFKDLGSFYTLPGQQINDSMSDLQQNYRQLFCGLPSLHCESLVVSILGSQEFSVDGTMSKLPMKDHFLFQELSLSPLLPKTPPQSIQPSSQPSSNETPSSEHQETQNNVPFLTLAECEALEWHLLQKQFQLQWGLPVILQGSQHVLSPVQHLPYDKSPSSGTAETSRTVETSCGGKTTSVLRRGFLYFPVHSRRSLDFHLQRQLIHHRWGLPQKIQQSRQLLLSHNDQQPLSWRNTGEDTSVRVSQPIDLNAALASEPFSHVMDSELVYMPHLFAQAKATLQNHINSKCGQILQGNVPACIYSSGEHSIPEDLQVAPFTCIPESKTLELQVANDPDSQDKSRPRSPVTLDQQQQDPSAVVPEHPKIPQILSKGALEKLEMTLKHKYLTFLSGLPTLYYVALSRTVSPETIAQVITTKTVPKPEESLVQPQSQKTSSKEQIKEATEATELVKVESESEIPSSISVKKPILDKLKFHLKKKILEAQLGIPIKARTSREIILETPEDITKITTQEPPESLSKQEKALSNNLSVPADTPCDLDPDQLHHKKQLGIELKAVQQNQKQPLASEAPQGSNNWASKISHPSGEITETQVLCVHLEASVSNPIVEEPSDHEPHSSGKSMDSAQPLVTHDRKHSEESNLRGSQTKENVILKPARVAQYAQSTRPHMSQGQALLKQPLQRKPLQGQKLQNRVVQGQRMPVPTHKRPSLAESDLRSKVKSFLHSINPPKTIANSPGSSPPLPSALSTNGFVT
ncbi:protein SPATA31F1-like [Sorex fumeus]|uniref:protein SPATA31F1-like n=1 Tax=Sorex fumeus TaxID=62283 RepID=UPI0024ADB8AB|nr:protein SPATA31F1-like [Sorex fumeus]